MSRGYGKTSRWLAILPVYAKAVEPQVLAVFTLNTETAKMVRDMKIENVAVNPKPRSAKVTTIYDEFETLAPAVREGE